MTAWFHPAAYAQSVHGHESRYEHWTVLSPLPSLQLCSCCSRTSFVAHVYSSTRLVTSTTSTSLAVMSEKVLLLPHASYE